MPSRAVLALLCAALAFACATAPAPSEQVQQPGTAEWVDTPVGKAVRVGPGVKAPVVIKRAEPRYPNADRESWIQGEVKLDTVIGESGNIIHTTILSAPSTSLGIAAQESAMQWTFRPAEVDGRPVQSLFELTIAFKLSK
ncbi:MAG TPA: energy transducer TonB [Thermoanaerobaculia bacterium]|jgi:protein TonB|nr:energy transducer TonB [Thermoanaerobaculia bacterium]